MCVEPCRRVMRAQPPCCYDNLYRPNYHDKPKQRYVSPTTGRCRPLIVQAVHPNRRNTKWTEDAVRGPAPNVTELAIWLSSHPPITPKWFVRWVLFTSAIISPSDDPNYTGSYHAYLSRYYGQLWVARTPHEYSLRGARLGVEDTYEITHSTHPRRLVIYDPSSKSWEVCSDPDVIKQQKYIAISYRYEDIVPDGTDKEEQSALKTKFIAEVEAVAASLDLSAYWIDLTLIDKTEDQPSKEVDKDLYRMADVYRSAEFTLIMLGSSAGVTEETAWLAYGQRLWTFPEALLSHELRYKFRDGDVTRISLHQLANRAYAGFAEESAVINAYGLKDPLERLERLSLLKSAIWRRTSTTLEKLALPGAKQHFRAERVYALMGFFEHRIHPHFEETELQAFARLSMANDNDRIIERMVSFLPSHISPTASWYAEEDGWGAKLWDIEPEIQVVGMAANENEAIVLGGCRAAAIRWKGFPDVSFATKPSIRRSIAIFIPSFFWYMVFNWVSITALFTSPSRLAWIPLIVGLTVALLSPVLVAYGSSGRIVAAEPWLVGVKGLISVEEASELMYGGTIFGEPRTFYTASGTLHSKVDKGIFRCGDKTQWEDLQRRSRAQTEDDDLYTLIDTLSATIYYFRAERPPTVCLYTGRESGMGRFVLCSERCWFNDLHKETVIRMPWYVSQSMPVCDWVAIG